MSNKESSYFLINAMLWALKFERLFIDSLDIINRIIYEFDQKDTSF